MTILKILWVKSCPTGWKKLNVYTITNNYLQFDSVNEIFYLKMGHAVKEISLAHS